MPIRDLVVVELCVDVLNEMILPVVLEDMDALAGRFRIDAARLKGY